MQRVLKSALAAAACCFGMAASSPSQAQGWHYYPTQRYSIYQNPDGTYPSLAALSRDIWGVPCGIECTQDAQARWSHYYAYGHRYRGE
ncbi:hypothetical protein [uncultured Methylovirgula sp.]|uniref:hypothetical protein n=1 Tax=uncultured Methylovirgula sp. TaxID=1285960 RepID=UPI0026224E70|nr:hypothetical protein [uncultured Methylovirgula sp.]